MADNNALLATALLSQQRRNDPAENSRRYAQLLMQQSLQTPKTPVQSVPEGIARALQQGIGGLIGGIQNQRDLDRQALTNQGLIEYATAKPGSPEQSAAMEKLKGGDPSIVGALAAQQIGLNQAQGFAGASAKNFNAAYGYDASGNPLPAGQSGVSVPITPQSTAPLTSAPQTGGQTGAYDPAKAVDFLTNDPDLKLAPHQAAGLVANLQRESSMVPTAVNPGDGSDGSNSVGMGQWNAGRAVALNKFAADNKLNPTDPQTQMAFIKSELMGPESAALTALRAAPDAATAAAAGVGYFRPKDTAAATAEAQRRVLTMPGGIQVAQAPVITPAGTQPGAPPLAMTPSGTRIDPSIPAPPFMGGQQVAGAPGAPPNAALNVPNAAPPAAVPPAAAPPTAAPPTAGAVPSAPPLVPLPRPTAEQINRYNTMLNNSQGKMSEDAAHQQLQAELRAQQAQQQAIATAAWQQQKAEEMAKTTSTRKAGELFTENTLNDYKTNVRPKAEAAVAGIQNGYQIRQLLDQGAFTGAGAGSAIALDHVKQVLGMDPSTKIANTQVLQSQLASGVLQGIGKLTPGASKADNEFIQNAPNITWDEQSLRKLVDISQREMQRRIDVHDKTAANILKFGGMNEPGIAENFQLPERPPTYEQWQKQNAPQAAAPAPQQPGTAPAPVRVSTPDEARKLPSGTPIILPDGRTGRVP